MRLRLAQQNRRVFPLLTRRRVPDARRPRLASVWLLGLVPSGESGSAAGRSREVRSGSGVELSGANPGPVDLFAPLAWCPSSGKPAWNGRAVLRSWVGASRSATPSACRRGLLSCRQPLRLPAVSDRGVFYRARSGRGQAGVDMQDAASCSGFCGSSALPRPSSSWPALSRSARCVLLHVSVRLHVALGLGGRGRTGASASLVLPGLLSSRRLTLDSLRGTLEVAGPVASCRSRRRTGPRPGCRLAAGATSSSSCRREQDDVVPRTLSGSHGPDSTK